MASTFTPSSLSSPAACFRYLPPDLPEGKPEREEYLDRLNERLMAAIQMHGPSSPRTRSSAVASRYGPVS